MRHTTPEEKAAYEAMIARISLPLFTEADLKALEDRCDALYDLVCVLYECSRSCGCDACENTETCTVRGKVDEMSRARVAELQRERED